MKVKTLLTTLMIGFAAVLILTGCEKKQPTATQNQTDQTAMPKDMVMNTTAAAVDATIMQKTCPISGNPIDKNVFVEYKGKKVYFCCADCKAAFQADPEKYISKLPQFQK